VAVTATPYGAALLHLGNARLDFGTHTFKVALCSASYTPNIDTHDYFDDITNEITGTGYTAGGATLASLAWTYDSGSNTAKLTANPTTWSAATFTTRYAIVYRSTGTASTSPLVSYVDFGQNESPAAIDFVINWAATGIIAGALQ
jgi:hypothetical protein